MGKLSGNLLGTAPDTKIRYARASSRVSSSFFFLLANVLAHGVRKSVSWKCSEQTFVDPETIWKCFSTSRRITRIHSFRRAVFTGGNSWKESPGWNMSSLAKPGTQQKEGIPTKNDGRRRTNRLESNGMCTEDDRRTLRNPQSVPGD